MLEVEFHYWLDWVRRLTMRATRASSAFRRKKEDGIQLSGEATYLFNTWYTEGATTTDQSSHSSTSEYDSMIKYISSLSRSPGGGEEIQCRNHVSDVENGGES